MFNSYSKKLTNTQLFSFIPLSTTYGDQCVNILNKLFVPKLCFTYKIIIHIKHHNFRYLKLCIWFVLFGEIEKYI